MIKIVDITTEVMLQNQKSENKVLEMINATVSHELRNPLNSVSAINVEKEMLYEELFGLLKSNQHRCQQIVLQLIDSKKVQDTSVNLIKFIIQDLLDYSQIKAFKFRKNLQLCDIRSCVQDVMNIQKQKADDQNIKLVCTFEDFEHYEILADENRIKQVLLNLQSNALKYIKRGSINIKVKSLYQDDNQFIQISVQDTGIGIKPENMNKLFKLFGYMDRDDDSINKHGIGLGLAISKKIVQEFEGDISCESVMGLGSTFTFTMKIQQELHDIIEVNSDQFLSFRWNPDHQIQNQLSLFANNFPNDINIERGLESTQRLSYCHSFDVLIPQIQNKILIVDDEPFNRMACKILLTSIGIQNIDQICFEANDGQMALEMIQDDYEMNGICSYELLFMDFNMPFLNGCQASKAIREYLYSQNVVQPIICGVSGQVDDDLSRECLVNGMNHIFSKPLEFKKLESFMKLFKK